jgi:hypothetical protein
MCEAKASSKTTRDQATADRTGATTGRGGLDTVPKRQPSTRGLLRIFPGATDEATRAWKIPKPATVGRGASAEIRLDDRKVSRLHARLEPRSHGYVVRDLGSRTARS